MASIKLPFALLDDQRRFWWEEKNKTSPSYLHIDTRNSLLVSGYTDGTIHTLRIPRDDDTLHDDVQLLTLHRSFYGHVSRIIKIISIKVPSDQSLQELSAIAALDSQGHLSLWSLVDGRCLLYNYHACAQPSTYMISTPSTKHIFTMSVSHASINVIDSDSLNICCTIGFKDGMDMLWRPLMCVVREDGACDGDGKGEIVDVFVLFLGDKHEHDFEQPKKVANRVQCQIWKFQFDDVHGCVLSKPVALLSNQFIDSRVIDTCIFEEELYFASGASLFKLVTDEDNDDNSDSRTGNQSNELYRLECVWLNESKNGILIERLFELKSCLAIALSNGQIIIPFHQNDNIPNKLSIESTINKHNETLVNQKRLKFPPFSLAINEQRLLSVLDVNVLVIDGLEYSLSDGNIKSAAKKSRVVCCAAFEDKDCVKVIFGMDDGRVADCSLSGAFISSDDDEEKVFYKQIGDDINNHAQRSSSITTMITIPNDANGILVAGNMNGSISFWSTRCKRLLCHHQCSLETIQEIFLISYENSKGLSFVCCLDPVGGFFIFRISRYICPPSATAHNECDIEENTVNGEQRLIYNDPIDDICIECIPLQTELRNVKKIAIQKMIPTQCIDIFCRVKARITDSSMDASKIQTVKHLNLQTMQIQTHPMIPQSPKEPTGKSESSPTIKTFKSSRDKQKLLHDIITIEQSLFTPTFPIFFCDIRKLISNLPLYPRDKRLADLVSTLTSILHINSHESIVSSTKVFKNSAKISIGMIGANGNYSFPHTSSKNSTARINNSNGDNYENYGLSTTFSAQLTISLLSILNSPSTTTKSKMHSTEHLGLLFTNSLFVLPSLAIICKYWHDPIMPIRNASRQIVGMLLHEFDAVSHDQQENGKPLSREIIGLEFNVWRVFVEFWSDRLPVFVRNSETKKKIPRRSMSRAAIILGVLFMHIRLSSKNNARMNSLFTESLIVSISQSLLLLIKDEHKVMFRNAAIELVGLLFDSLLNDDQGDFSSLAVFKILFNFLKAMIDDRNHSNDLSPQTRINSEHRKQNDNSDEIISTMLKLVNYSPDKILSWLITHPLTSEADEEATNTAPKELLTIFGFIDKICLYTPKTLTPHIPTLVDQICKMLQSSDHHHHRSHNDRILSYTLDKIYSHIDNYAEIPWNPSFWNQKHLKNALVAIEHSKDSAVHKQKTLVLMLPLLGRLDGTFPFLAYDPIVHKLAIPFDLSDYYCDVGDRAEDAANSDCDDHKVRNNNKNNASSQHTIILYDLLSPSSTPKTLQGLTQSATLLSFAPTSVPSSNAITLLAYSFAEATFRCWSVSNSSTHSLLASILSVTSAINSNNVKPATTTVVPAELTEAYLDAISECVDCGCDTRLSAASKCPHCTHCKYVLVRVEWKGDPGCKGNVYIDGHFVCPISL